MAGAGRSTGPYITVQITPAGTNPPAKLGSTPRWSSSLRLDTDHTAKTVCRNSKQLFLEMKLRGLNPNSYIHIFVSDLYTVYSPDRFAYSAAGK